MRILVLTLMIVFLSHSAFGAEAPPAKRHKTVGRGAAAEGGGAGCQVDKIREEIFEKIFKKLFIDEYGPPLPPQITTNDKKAAAKVLEHLLFLERNEANRDFEPNLKNLISCIRESLLWQNTFLLWFSYFEKKGRVLEVAASSLDRDTEVAASMLRSLQDPLKKETANILFSMKTIK